MPSITNAYAISVEFPSLYVQAVLNPSLICLAQTAKKFNCQPHGCRSIDHFSVSYRNLSMIRCSEKTCSCSQEGIPCESTEIKHTLARLIYIPGATAHVF